MRTIHRHPVSVFANGCEAVLHVHEIAGARKGPTIGISAAIHGDEQTGPQIILDFARGLDESKLAGRLLIVPVANPLSFEANTRHSPIDDLNLNRLFPGEARGWYSEQLARVITNHFLDKVDVLIDIHAGGRLPTVDYVYIRNDEGLSRSFLSKVLYKSKSGMSGTMYAGTAASVTDARGIPSVVIECGGGPIDQRGYVKRGVAGLANMLRHLKVLDGAEIPPPPQITVGGIEIIRPTRGGFMEVEAPPLGERIAKGAVLGRVVSPYTFETLETILNPVDNGVMILAHLDRTLTQPGDYGFMVGAE